MTTASPALVTLHCALACSSELEAVHALLGAASERLASRGFPNWLPVYPRELLAADIEAQVVRTVRDPAGTLVATYMLRVNAVRPYAGITWAREDATPRFLNRLAVSTARQGEGIGRWCLARMAQECAAEGADAIRCDVLAANVPLRRFYEHHGYVARGERYHSDWHFTVYEHAFGEHNA